MMRVCSLLLAVLVAIVAVQATVVTDRRHLLQTASAQLADLNADLEAAKDNYRLTGASPYEAFGNVISGVRGIAANAGAATDEMKSTLAAAVAAIPDYSVIFSADNTLDLINGAMAQDDLITNPLISAALTELESLTTAKLTQEQDEQGTLHEKTVSIVRTVLIRNVALSSAAAAGGESTATALANVSRGLALTESVFSLLSNVKSYLSVGQTFKMVYNQNNDAAMPKNFDSIIEKVSVPLADTKTVSVSLPAATVSAELRFDALTAAGGDVANVLLWATEPDFIQAATQTDASAAQLSPVSAGLVFTDAGGSIFDPRAVADGSVKVTIPFSLGPDDINCRLPCRPVCMMWDKANSRYTGAGIPPGALNDAQTEMTCSVARSGYFAVVGAVPAADRCEGFSAEDNDVCAAMFIPSIQVRLSDVDEWTQKSMADIAAAVSTTGDSFGPARLEASNAATGGFTVYFTIKGFTAELPAGQSIAEFNADAQAVYDDLREQSGVPQSTLRLLPDVGSKSNEDSFTQLCGDNTFKPTCIIAKATADDDDDDTVMIVAVVGGIGAIAAIGGAAMYMKKKK